MTKLLNALRRTFGDPPYTEPVPHFHAGASGHEVCFEDACSRPQLAP
jgi:hypothetical protein